MLTIELPAELIGMHDEAPSGVLSPRTPAIAAENLRSALASLAPPMSFKVNDIVRWKPFMRQFRFPDYGQPAIIAEVFEQPLLHPEQDAGHPCYRTYLTGRIGVLLGPQLQDFGIFYADLSRFELYPPAELELTP